MSDSVPDPLCDPESGSKPESPFSVLFDAMPSRVRRLALAVCWGAPFGSAYFILRGQMTGVGMIVCTALLGIFIGLTARLAGLFVYGIWRVSKPVGHDELSQADRIFLRIVNVLVILAVLTIIWCGFAAPSFLPYRYGIVMLILAITLIGIEVYR